jgi:TRAP-type uncharacterized transport system fused permease subunit
MGLAVFIVPFMFFYSPLLLGQGSLVQILPVLGTALVGVVLLACATEGWFGRPIGWGFRAPLLVASLCLMVPEPITDAVGLAIAAGVFLGARMVRNPTAA